MSIEEIRELSDEDLLALSLERKGKYNKYTSDALKAQAEWNNRKGNCLHSGTTTILSKHDHSAYSRY